MLPRLLPLLSLTLTLLGLLAAFLPYGWGFVTFFTATVSLVSAIIANKMNRSRLARWATWLSPLPVLAYGVFLLMMIPTKEEFHEVRGMVSLRGALPDQTMFTAEQRASGPVHGVVIEVDDCSPATTLRTTLDVSECFQDLDVGDSVPLIFIMTQRWATGKTKGYRLSSVGSCTLSDDDSTAIVTLSRCPKWGI